MRILITGITGFLGRNLVTYVEDLDDPITVGGLSRDEHKLFSFQQAHPSTQMYLGDLRDAQRVAEICSDFRPDLVIHAAALKVVPTSELYPHEYIRTNILGTLNLLSAVGDTYVVLISSDKAVEARNVYGMTKALAEKLVLRRQQTVIRYGNVFGATGSVFPVWKRQVAEGKPITLTDPQMTRFLITARRAIQVVWDRLGHPGLWVPKLRAYTMGDFLSAFLSLLPMPWDVQRIPVRPGEKIHEYLVSEEEALTATEEVGGYLLTKAGPGITRAVCSKDAPRVTRSELAERMDTFWDEVIVSPLFQRGASLEEN